MSDKEIIKIIEETLEEKMQKDDKFIKYSFYELKINKNLTDEELDRFLNLIKIKLEKMNYIVMFTGTKYVYKNANRTVQDNELMVAIEKEEYENK